MVVTGWYDKYQPLNIMTDFLIRAILAHDTDEAIQLGILETDPEDFALAAFIDPAKTDFCGIVKQGLEEIEKEGI
jgi:Na+-transporting NADH:ubiquinone oxidoreductase subunit A